MKSLSFVLFALFGFLSPSLSGDAPKSFYQISEIVQNWTPDQHLWNKGSLNLSDNKLVELEQWLDEKAPNWTVVLMQDAQGQVFENHRGVRAVEHALGKGLPNQTGFSDLKDSRTNQANGAIFALFLSERKFSYFASQSHDSRNLGEHYWVGRLDQPAVRAMRGGGRIVDAVKDTISGIENSLTKSLQQEENRRRLAAIERRKAIDEAKGYPVQLLREIQAVQKKVSELRESHPNLIGPVIHPDLAGWNATRETIARLAEQGDTRNAQKHYAETLDAIRSFRSGMREWEEAPETIASLDQQIQKHPIPENAPAVEGHLSKAGRALDSAKENHETGEPLYVSQIQEAERELSNAGVDYRTWVKAEQQNRQIRIAIVTLLALALLTFLFVSNRMRRPTKLEAEKLLAHWQEELRGKFDTLFSLMDRTGVVVGTRSDLLANGLEGTTKRVGLRTIRSVDELFIMSSATDQVILQVNELLQPTSAFLRILNVFSSRRYRAAIELFQSEPIGFDQGDHLEAILSPSSTGTERDRATGKLLLGEKEDYKPFRISFEKLILEYDQRQEQAQNDLARLEAGIDGLPLSLQRLLEGCEEVREVSDRLALQAGEDTLFPMVSLRQELVPSTAENLESLGSLGEKDPLLAFEEELSLSTRLVVEARALVHHIESFRAIDLPVILEKREDLISQNRKVGWIGEALREMTSRSENLSRQAREESITEASGDLRDDLTRLKGRVISCCEMSRLIQGELRQAIRKSATDIETARKDLSEALSLPSDKLLNEPDLSPDDQVARASQELEAALSAIDHGEAESAQDDLADLEKCLDDAKLMIRMSRGCVEEHGERIEALENFRTNLIDEVEPVSRLLKELETEYSPSVLLFSSRFGEEIEGQQSVTNCIERATRRLDQGLKDLEESRQAFQDGALIRASGLLEAIANELGFARHQLELVRDQHGALRDAEESNGKSEHRLSTWIRELQITGADPRTGPDSMSSLQAALTKIEVFADDRKQSPSDPFQLSQEAAGINALLRTLEDGIKADWEAHDLAESTATGARAGLTFCHTYLREAQQDGVPDSRALTRAIQRHEELTQELNRLTARLESAHQDWGELFEQINGLIGETSKVRATLEEELKSARDAVAQMKSAAASIRSLQRWRSSHSVFVDRRAGNKHLLEAKQALALGDYLAARAASVRASGEAVRAMKKAQTREAQAVSAAAAARRAAMFNSSSSSSSSSFSSFGGGSSFSSSSGSGFSSSGFSSGSGFSSSGW